MFGVWLNLLETRRTSCVTPAIPKRISIISTDSTSISSVTDAVTNIIHAIPFCTHVTELPLLPANPLESFKISCMSKYFAVWRPTKMDVIANTDSVSDVFIPDPMATSENRIRREVSLTFCSIPAHNDSKSVDILPLKRSVCAKE